MKIYVKRKESNMSWEETSLKVIRNNVEPAYYKKGFINRIIKEGKNITFQTMFSYYQIIFDCANPNGLTKEDYYNKVEELVCDKVAEFMKTTDKIIEVDLIKYNYMHQIEIGYQADVMPESIAKLIYRDIIIYEKYYFKPILRKPK